MSAKYKFDDLAGIAKKIGIDPQKQGKTKKVNKTKTELYAEIKKKLGRSPTGADLTLSRKEPQSQIAKPSATKVAAKPPATKLPWVIEPSTTKGAARMDIGELKKALEYLKKDNRLENVKEMMKNPIELLILGDAQNPHPYDIFKGFKITGSSTDQWLMIVPEDHVQRFSTNLQSFRIPYLTDREFMAKINQFPIVRALAVMPNLKKNVLPETLFRKLADRSVIWTTHNLTNDNFPSGWAIKNHTTDKRVLYRIERYDIVKIVEPLPSSPVKPIPKLRPYKVVNLVGMKVGKMKDTPPTPTEERIGITVEDFRKELDNPEFITRFYNSARALMATKSKDYFEKLDQLKVEYERLKKKADRLKDKGIDLKTIEKAIPLEDYSLFLVEMEDIIEIVNEKYNNLTTTKLAADLRDAMDNKKKGLASIIGRDDIKNQLVTQLYAFSKSWKTFYQSFNNMALLGSAGSGKTAIAKVIGYMFSKSGILATDKVIIVSRVDLVGQYVGSTAPKTRSVLMQTMEGVLLIDEAYQLTPCPEAPPTNDFGPEAITEIVNFLDKYIGLSVVIVAGYEGVMMRCFFANNEGLPRRFPFRYVLGAYTISELTDILIHFVHSKSDVRIDQETANILFSLITQIQLDAPDAFQNQAGDMLNLGTALVKAINSSFRIIWKEGDVDNNMPLIMAGFNDFLRMKGLRIGKL